MRYPSPSDVIQHFGCLCSSRSQRFLVRLSSTGEHDEYRIQKHLKKVKQGLRNIQICGLCNPVIHLNIDI